MFAEGQNVYVCVCERLRMVLLIKAISPPPEPNDQLRCGAMHRNLCTYVFVVMIATVDGPFLLLYFFIIGLKMSIKYCDWPSFKLVPSIAYDDDDDCDDDHSLLTTLWLISCRTKTKALPSIHSFSMP